MPKTQHLRVSYRNTARQNDSESHFQLETNSPDPHTSSKKHMIVCHCHALTDRDIRSAVKSGATCPNTVGDACGAGTGCGGCVEVIEEIVEEELTASGARHVHSLPVIGSSSSSLTG
jgi:bacterioferritin-associated ferredoxin